MSEPLDFPHLESACWRALCRHDVSENEMVVAATIIRLSFVIGEPFLRLDYAIELARLTGLQKGKASEVVKRLTRGRALQVSADRCIYTFLPPSKAWPWLFDERVNPQIADELERGIVWANKGGQRQGELFSPPVEQEFAEALAIERMRAGLLEYHHAAAARFGGEHHFPATDRLLTPAPAPLELSSGEGPSRPLETSGRVGNSSEESLPSGPEEASEMPAPRPLCPLSDDIEKGSRIENPGSESRTALLRALRASEESKALSPLKALRGGFSNREPLDPGASEDEIVAWLRGALGTATMDRFGGWWRLRIRESRWSAVNTCMELRLRLTDLHLKPLRNPGGWARDQYLKIRGEEESMKP